MQISRGNLFVNNSGAKRVWADWLLTFALIFQFCLWSGQAASVLPGAGYTNAFAVQPTATDWATLSVEGSGSDSYQMDADVNGTITAAGVGTATTSDAEDPPAANASATWSSAGGYLQTRPTGNRATMLMGKFVNGTGSNATQITLSYSLRFGGTDGAATEEIGSRVYYSLTGTSGSWVNLAALNSTANNGTMSVSTNLAINWPNGASLFLLWADDNANMGTDAGYQIDNFSLRVTAGIPLFLACAVLSPTNGASFVSGTEITATVAASGGTSPYAITVWTNNGAGNTIFKVQGTYPTASAQVAYGALPVGTYNLYTSVMDNEGSTAISATNSFVVADPITVTLTSPGNNASIEHTVAVIGEVSINGGTGPFAVQYYRDDVADGEAATTPPYTHNFGTLFVGDHTVRVEVTDSKGWTGSSAVHGINITGPLAVKIVPVDGTSYNYGQPLVITATVGGGTAPYTAMFYNNGQMAGTAPVAPYSYNLGVVPPGTYAVYTEATDSSPTMQRAFSSTNTITIVPNPLLATLTTPTNGVAGVGFPLSVVATVQLPVTVAQVEFFVDGALLATDAALPFSTTFPSPSIGIHTFYAVATDSLGRQTYTATNQVNFIDDPLANDNFANRFALGTPANITGSNVGANTETGEPTSEGWFTRWGATMWYSWTAPANGTVVMDTFGSGFNTVLSAYTGSSVSALTLVRRNDNAPGRSDVSQITFTAVQGQEYQIQVGGSQGFGGGAATGNYLLNVTMPPSVSLISPTNGNVVTTGSDVLISATATGIVASITQVDFYSGTTLLGSLANPPYELVVNNLNPGTNAIYAVVHDSIGQATTTPTANVLVANIGITLVAPVDERTFANLNPVTMAVYTFLPEGAITNVVFFVDGRPIGADNAAPFNYSWIPTGGSHQLMAVGKSDSGVSYYSQAIYVAVPTYLVVSGAVWKYLDDGSDQGTYWALPEFDDSVWASGPAQLGYGDGDEATVVNSGPTNDVYVTTYFRRGFYVRNPTDYATVQINIRRDDGAVVYLNGVEVGRFNMNGGPVDYRTFANNASDNGNTWMQGSSIPATYLVAGTNVLAVEIHQTSTNSSDISFDLEMLGVPRVVRNAYPEVALIRPADKSTSLLPLTIRLEATASDSDGSIAMVEFYEGDTKIGESANAPYIFDVAPQTDGIYTFTAIAIDNEGAIRISDPAVVTVYASASHWIAYNDHSAGPQTHPNATAWNAFGAPGEEGALRAIQDGTPLPAWLTIYSFGVAGDSTSAAPLPGTPAYDLFQGYVDFGSGGANESILVDEHGMVMHLFTGLDPNRVYSIRATAMAGVPEYSNRWTLFTIMGAQSYQAAHTPNVLTWAQQPTLAADEAAMNTGDNRTGDVVGWDQILPGTDGSFFVISSQYVGPAPGNEHPGPVAYAPVAIRMEEFGGTPLVQMTAPSEGAVITGPTNILVSAMAISLVGITNVEFQVDGNAIGNASASPYEFIWNTADFGGHLLTAVAYDTEGYTTTSAPVAMTLITPPTNTIAPYIAGQDPMMGSSLTNLTSVMVEFSHYVEGVDASDLLINGVAATNVIGSNGSNYVFWFEQPAYGVVNFTWSTNANISDLSWPEHLPFYDVNPDNYWSYQLIDKIPPMVLDKTPATTNGYLTNLTQVTVYFTEPVQGVQAEDFLVNNTPAYDMTGSGNQYTFSFSQPPSGNVKISWAANHGIADLAATPNPFVATNANATWTYQLDTRTRIIQSNAMFLYMKGTQEPSSPTNAWREVGFDDSAWTSSAAPFYDGDSGYTNTVDWGTPLSDMAGNYSSIYLRKTFMVGNPAAVSAMLMMVQCDDGFVMWVNGREVKRVNVGPNDLSYNAYALNPANEPQTNGAAFLNYALPNPPRLYLVPGTNVIAVHVLNERHTNSISDFGFNMILFAFLSDTEMSAPRLTKKEPTAGNIFALTNITVTFSEAITNVDASDLLLNGVPATALSSTTNTVYTFGFPQPPYGLVSITWAADHGIVDLDSTPKPFASTISSAVWDYTLLNANAPYLTSVGPPQGATIYDLQQIDLVFNKPVTGVDAADLLINGSPAATVTGSGANYTFRFPRPAYGTVTVGWASGHGIADLSMPPNSFDGAYWPGHTWTYEMIDQTPPVVLALDPPSGSPVMNLTEIVVTFSEPVLGVNAADLLINGQPAQNVVADSATYTFSFPQPNANAITVVWAGNHGIIDTATNVFDANDLRWNYPTTDNVPPSLTSVYPLPSATVRSLRHVTLTFDELVQNIAADMLTINGVAAEELSGSGVGPYVFGFTQPVTGLVQVALSSLVRDLAIPANQFRGSNWTYTLDTNLPQPTISRGPYLQTQTTNSMIVRWRTSTATDSSVRYGFTFDTCTNVVNDWITTTEHLVALTNLLGNTLYYYNIGTTDGGTVADTNFYFTTAPPIGVARPTRIWFISDYGFKDSSEASVRNSYFNYVASVKPADVWITGGDNDQTDGRDSNLQTAVFGTTYGYGNLVRNTVLWPTIGNHDYQTSQGQAYYASFSMPTNGQVGGVPSGTQHYYSFDYANIHFISLDSIVGTYSSSTNTEMTRWLIEDLSSTTQKWIIAYWHGSVYSKASHDSDSDSDTLAWMVQMRQNILPILEAYGVDLVLNGHSHAYERTWMLQGHYGYSTTFSDTHKVDGGDGKVNGTGAYLKTDRGPGTVYVTAAVGGQLQNRMSVQHPAHLLKISTALGSLVMDVDGDRLDFQFINTSGVALDNFTISKEPQPFAPSAPANLAAIQTGPGQCQITWANTPNNEMGFIIERSLNGTTYVQIGSVGANMTSFTDTAFPVDGIAFYRIRGWNETGTGSAGSVSIGVDYQLAISQTPTAMLVVWPASATAFALQSSPTLGPTATWQTVNTGIVTNGTSKVYTITTPVGTPPAFFRLQKQ